MFKYNYYRVKNLQDLSKQLIHYGSKAQIIAGGTDLMVQIYEKHKHWKDLECILDISSLRDEMRYIKENDDTICIGALSTHTDIEKSEIINKYLPALAYACETVGSPQIRNLGTVGGSICNASPASDPLTPMIVAGTTVIIQGEAGVRKVDLPAFYFGKSKIDLNAGEFVKEFIVSKLPEEMRTKFVKLGRRKALAISRLNVTAGLTIDTDGKIKEARLSPGCIFIKPDRVTRAEELLIGQTPSKKLFHKSGEIVSEVMIERTGIRWSTEYKKPAVEGIVEEALLRAAGMEV
ncbi:MAG: FAD binding domain-containing protein [Lachnospirales bacterium]